MTDKQKKELSTVDKGDLLPLIYTGISSMEGKLGQYATRLLGGVGIFLTIQLAVFLIVFNRIEDNAKEIESVGADLTDIDGALESRLGRTAVFGQRRTRELLKRGSE